MPDTTKPPIKVVILYKPDSHPDEELLHLLESELTRSGYSIYIDRHRKFGVEWAEEIDRHIRDADAEVPLLSAASVRSEMIGFEIECAHEAALVQHGRPAVLPVRVNYTGPLPEQIAGFLESDRYLLWQGPQDDQRLVADLLDALKNLRCAKPALRIAPAKGLRLKPRQARAPKSAGESARQNADVESFPLEPVGGAVPLQSGFYLVRPADADLRAALTRYDGTILIKGARQMGKTSILARGLQFARERGAIVALNDFQKLNAADLESVGDLYLTLAESLADQLDLKVLPSDVWDEHRGPNVNFEEYLRHEVLAKLNAPFIWGLDEVDRLFVCSFGNEVFGLFRSWHNERALDPTGPWAGLTLAIAFATEAHLFITDMNQSPFNVGTRIALEDFTPEQVVELNRRHGSPLKDETELNHFIKLVGGHPYLVRCGLHEMTGQKIGIDSFESQAAGDEGIFGDHLRRILVLLAKDPALTEIVRGVLRGKPCPTSASFYRLRSAGVMSGSSQSDVRPRCQLYATYLSRHLL